MCRGRGKNGFVFLWIFDAISGILFDGVTGFTKYVCFWRENGVRVACRRRGKNGFVFADSVLRFAFLVFS